MVNYKPYQDSGHYAIDMPVDSWGSRRVETLLLLGACSIVVYDIWLAAPVILAGLQ
jgi:hypothetical protein